MGESQGDVYFLLDKILNELNIPKTKFAKMSGVRKATLFDIYDNKFSRLDRKNLVLIMNTLNEIAEERGLEREFRIEDIMKYVKGS